MSRGTRTASILSTAAALWLIWIFLTLDTGMDELLLGLSLSLLVAVTTGGAFTGNLLRILRPRRLVLSLEYIVYFLGKMIAANIDVLFRVIKPRVPVNPGIVRAELKLGHQRARNIVANSITLTPGTLTVDTTDNEIFVHWISLPSGDVQLETQRMVDGFAKRLEKIFD